MRGSSALCRLRLLLPVVFLCHLSLASANILIFESSDNHSEYSHALDFIRTTSYLRQDFLRRNGIQSPVVHLLNGDNFGISTWTMNGDNGELGFRMFEQLARDSIVIPNTGNHDGWDAADANNNLFHMNQFIVFLKELSQSAANRTMAKDVALYSKNPKHIIHVGITTANVIASEHAKPYFRNYQDILSPSKKKIRVVGLVLEKFFNFSRYNRTLPYQSIETIRPMLDVAKEQLLQAAKDDVSAVIFMCHEYQSIVIPFVKELMQWKKQAELNNPALAAISLPVVFAGHDHLVASVKIAADSNTESKQNYTWVIDSGSDYAFSTVELDDDGQFLQTEHFPIEKQKKYQNFSQLLEPEETALIMLQKKVNEITDYDFRVIGQTQGFDLNRSELKRGRKILGDYVCNSYRDWGLDVLSEKNRTALDVFSFLNTGSYRSSKMIPAGNLTVGMIRNIYPFPGQSKILLLKGKYIQKMFTALRSFGIHKHEYTPQLSSNIFEGNNFQLLHHRRQLESEKLYGLVLDPWLADNGFEIPEFDEAFKHAENVSDGIPADPHDILLKYLPRYLVNGPIREDSRLPPMRKAGEKTLPSSSGLSEPTKSLGSSLKSSNNCESNLKPTQPD